MKLIEKFQNQSALFGGNADYIEALFEQYLQDPSRVTEAWRQYFDSFSVPNDAHQDIPHTPIRESFAQLTQKPRTAMGSLALDSAAAQKQTTVLRLINLYRVRGHQEADLCPLHLRERVQVEKLTLAFHNLTEADMDLQFNSGTLTHQKEMRLRDIIDLLRDTYCRHVGVEFMHITKTSEKLWLQARIENTRSQMPFSTQDKIDTLKQLIAAEGLERYLHTRYVGQKRFSLEGGDALIPMMHELVNRASTHGAQEIVIGMAHRGRLNMLINVLGKAPADLFAEFEGKKVIANGAGDVKYHMGFSSSVKTAAGHDVHLALAFNPSHLEIVNPVVEGSVRARLERRREATTKTLPLNQVLPVLIHGDAAFAGQGVVMETMQLSQVRGYHTGGSVHIVINNQIGFTTSNPLDTRSASYCTDVAKMIQAPIFHVNGDDPEAVKFVTRLALDYRQTFNKDVVIDLVCYRRLGHNEADEPSATQPMMYQKIKAHATPAQVYATQLQQEGIITEEEFKALTDRYRKRLEEGKPVGFPLLPPVDTHFMTHWSAYFKENWQKVFKTSVTASQIKILAEKMQALPAGFVLHPRVEKIHEDRKKMAAGGLPIDWGFAEVMAYATLLDEGHAVRISGQDCGRGTFFHRHAVYHSQADGESYVPLTQLNPQQPSFVVIDSILSEEAVLGFEYGYATAEPNHLVIWEGQFGDFVNGAQVVIDQFISSGETKWSRLCGLVMLLPHGYEGQGPEHSSARPERFLQLCAENNMRVVVPTTPAQAFHMLRLQIHQTFRKPLVVMTPKSLLRHKSAVNSLEDLTEGHFQTVIADQQALDAKKVERVILTCGKVYYDLLEAAHEAQLTQTALIRIEQVYPFPTEAVTEQLKLYPHAKDIVWCQDEPKNQGYWLFIKEDVTELLARSQKLRFVGRPASASPAVGYHSVHVEQQKTLIAEALGLKK